MKRSTARSPFPWFGGKQKLADELVALFPPHDVYVEVFGGGGSVLFSKPATTLDVYVPETRRGGGYNHELTPEEHEELVERVLGLAGVAIVSGYEHPIYAPLVERGGFSRRTFGVWCTAAQRSPDRGRDRRVEVVWASPRAARPTLFDLSEAVA